MRSLSGIHFTLLLFCISAYATEARKREEECKSSRSLVGVFSEINDVRIGDHDTRPISSAIGTLKIRGALRA